ncbi:hypothetical protein THASP1DRAFT_31141 [Thamnocephalis sphaerospora]|uniref:Uncharacterized protein n=1 Tax=Thamnocephalis sphaerospora TaxID=78915 RepID=A0A4P9XP68_9FUNG|nr:hypothetical protein THASP1DRAFT_31141 [Thamnocephalis sphaerospora]|eukprot:RKP07050.1 hypothetical protein THASP1DRAFT_31141 [Thamnocephalis sphaerospora]
MADNKEVAAGNAIRPYVKATVRSTHPHLRFKAIGLYVKSGAGLKQLSGQQDEGNLFPNLIEQEARNVAFPTDDTPLDVYIGDPEGDEGAEGTFVLRIDKKEGGREPDADMYASITYDVPHSQGDLQHYMTIVETEPNVDLLKYDERLSDAYSSNWSHKMLGANYPIYHTYQTMAQPFIVKAQMKQDLNHGELDIELAEPGDEDNVYQREPYFVVAPLPNLSRTVQESVLAFDAKPEIWEVNDPEESTMMNFIVSHPDIILRNPHHFLLTGVVGDNPTERVYLDNPGVAYFLSTINSKSRGSLVYEILSRANDDNPDYVVGRRDRPYLVISWEVNPGIEPTDQEEEDGDPRYKFSAVILRADSPGFPTRGYSQKRLFEKLSHIILAKETHEWEYGLPDGVRFKLKLRVKPRNEHMAEIEKDASFLKGFESAATKYANENGENRFRLNAHHEPAILDVFIEQIDVYEEASVNRTYASPTLFVPSSGYYWENYNALLEINNQLRRISNWEESDVYSLVENSNRSIVKLQRVYTSPEKHRDVLGLNNHVVIPDKFDIFDCTLGYGGEAFRTVYTIQGNGNDGYGRSASTQREYFATMCNISQMHSTVVHEWMRDGSPRADGEAVARFLQDANVEASIVAGDMIESAHPVLNDAVLSIKQYRSFGRPNVATSIVYSRRVPGEQAFTDGKPAVRVTFASRIQGLRADWGSALSVGWKGISEGQHAGSDRPNAAQSWSFSRLAKREEEGRAVRVRIGFDKATGTGSLKTIELSVYAYPAADGTEDYVASGALITVPEVKVIQAIKPEETPAEGEAAPMEVDVVEDIDSDSEAEDDMDKPRPRPVNYDQRSDNLYLEKENEVLASQFCILEAYTSGSERCFVALHFTGASQGTEAELFAAAASTYREVERLLQMTLRSAGIQQEPAQEAFC